jgi:hypothetical protein
MLGEYEEKHGSWRIMLLRLVFILPQLDAIVAGLLASRIAVAARAAKARQQKERNREYMKKCRDFRMF